MTWAHSRTRRGLGVLLSVVACAGCMVGPDFARPKAAVAPSWLDAGDQRVKTGPAEYREWWKAFNDPALDHLVEQAYRENLSRRSAGMRVLQARAQLGIAIGEIFPQTQQATGSVQYNRTSDRSVTAAVAAATPTGSATSFDYWQSEIGLQASWELDFWGKL